MPQLSLKHRIINTLIVNIPIALGIVITAQLLANGNVQLIPSLINFALAYTISFLIGMFIPLVPWGLGFAAKCKAKEGSLPFGLLVNVVVNTGYVLIVGFCLTIFNIKIMGGAPWIAWFFGWISTFVPIWIVGYIISFLWNQPAEKITKAICKD